MEASRVDLSSDVLKVGHHGSDTSTTGGFLKTVSPAIAVIPVGASNSSGHPSPKVIERLLTFGVQIYRTDLHGSVVVSSDGQRLNVVAGKITSPGNAGGSVKQPGSKEYIGNKNTKKFHLPSCSSLPAQNNRIHFNSREEAIAVGYVPCKICNP
jgi:competence protein ComEC